MTKEEASKKLEFHSKQICHGCVHPSMVGWCENHCQLPEAFKMAIAALEKQEQDKWIPVSVRLPEDEYVLISKKPTKLSGSKWSVGIAIRIADPRSGKIQWRDSGFGVIQDDKVLAWQPLPESYQEDKV